ncbi:LPXTG cell wall anchor domain-containing protein [Streptomyces marokkonensis]|uniref:LPXTG cell wall anchor domain-containing protein n=1 Tax=Streptomyces marokkonensis TaxID=324855 RepID=A0ABP7ST63_9ACTN
MRRTTLSAVALACTAVLAATSPAFADDPSPVPSVPAGESAPSVRTVPREVPVPSAGVPGGEPAEAPAPAPADGQVSVVPEGAADTGVAAPVSSGGDESLAGAGAGAVLVAGGVVLFVVRRRRVATGA